MCLLPNWAEWRKEKMLQSPSNPSRSFGVDDGKRSSSKRASYEPEDSVGAGVSKDSY